MVVGLACSGSPRDIGGNHGRGPQIGIPTCQDLTHSREWGMGQWQPPKDEAKHIGS